MRAWIHERVGGSGHGIRGHFDSPDVTAEEWIWEVCPEKDREFVRGHLVLMLFSGDEAEKRLGTLSGGETARLVFSRLALAHPKVLVLDEPTNHLDMEAIEALVEGLDRFEGTILLVSHDRWFVEIRVDGIRDFPGTYAEYVAASGDDHLDADGRAHAGARAPAAGGSKNGADTDEVTELEAELNELMGR